jgi:hypothetical protein
LGGLFHCADVGSWHRTDMAQRSRPKRTRGAGCAELTTRAMWRSDTALVKNLMEAEMKRFRADVIPVCRPVRRIPRGAGIGLEDLPGALRQQQILGHGQRRRTACRGPCLYRPHRDPPGRTHGAVAGWDLHPLESAALSRRTLKSDIAPCPGCVESRCDAKSRSRAFALAKRKATRRRL